MRFFPRQLFIFAAVFAATVHSGNTADLTVNGVKVPKEITCGESALILNGTAVRSVWGFKVYVCALYLSEASRDDQHIMKRNRLGKRVHITMLREVSKEKFESTIQDNVDTNFSADEKLKFKKELEKFLGSFGSGSALKKGSTVNIDYIPEQGTVVSMGRKKFEAIPGEEFYHAILRLWIGKPPQDSLKSGLLGKAG